MYKIKLFSYVLASLAVFASFAEAAQITVDTKNFPAQFMGGAVQPGLLICFKSGKCDILPLKQGDRIVKNIQDPITKAEVEVGTQALSFVSCGVKANAPLYEKNNFLITYNSDKKSVTCELMQE